MVFISVRKKENWLWAFTGRKTYIGIIKGRKILKKRENIGYKFLYKMNK